MEGKTCSDHIHILIKIPAHRVLCFFKEIAFKSSTRETKYYQNQSETEIFDVRDTM